MRDQKLKIDAKQCEAALSRNLARLTRRYGWISTHFIFCNRYSIEYANRLWQVALDRGYVYRAKDGRILTTEKGDTI